MLGVAAMMERPLIGVAVGLVIDLVRLRLAVLGSLRRRQQLRIAVAVGRLRLRRGKVIALHGGRHRRMKGRLRVVAIPVLRLRGPLRPCGLLHRPILIVSGTSP